MKIKSSIILVSIIMTGCISGPTVNSGSVNILSSTPDVKTWKCDSMVEITDGSFNAVNGTWNKYTHIIKYDKVGDGILSSDKLGRVHGVKKREDYTNVSDIPFCKEIERTMINNILRYSIECNIMGNIMKSDAVYKYNKTGTCMEGKLHKYMQNGSSTLDTVADVYSVLQK